MYSVGGSTVIIGNTTSLAHCAAVQMILLVLTHWNNYRLHDWNYCKDFDAWRPDGWSLF
jgi:hypothetical protein